MDLDFHLNEHIKQTYAERLREAERFRLVVDSGRVSKLSPVLRILLFFLV